MTIPKIDIADPGIYLEGIPYGQYDWLRANAPVYAHPDPQTGGTFWAITKHEDVQYVSRNPDVFSSHAKLAMMNEFDEEGIAMQRLIMLNQDPPEHSRTRGLVNRGFTPRMIGKLEEHVREVCDDILDGVVERGEADFVHDIAAQLPLYVICELIGAPIEDREKIFRWSNQMVGFDDPEYFESTTLAAMEMMAYSRQLADERRGQPDRGDILSKLLATDENGDVLTPDEFDMFMILLNVAGNETTRTAANGGMQAFFEHPEQWRRLLADRSLMATAPDEIVRWTSPIIEFRRTAMRDVELRGETIKEGDKVVVFYHSANRDEEVFENPYTFDVGRDPNPHVGFGGGGPHFCLGTHLARLELRVLFETLLDRMPDIQPAGNIRRLRSNFVNGIKEMPVRFTPSERRG